MLTDYILPGIITLCIVYILLFGIDHFVPQIVPVRGYLVDQDIVDENEKWFKAFRIIGNTGIFLVLIYSFIMLGAAPLIGKGSCFKVS